MAESLAKAYLSLIPKMDEAGMAKVESKVGSLAKKAAGILAAAGIAKGVADITKAAFDAYAQQEQLVGGIETLYKESADAMLEYASRAYQTAGMSANEYMATSTSFAASLINSLGGDTAKAAEYADKAITDMSDNANKMGVSLESIQNAYRGFARGNFTMLDNLSLGFAGTKEGMQQLIDKANELRAAQGLNADLTIDSYADIVDAIHEVQTEMGITGTTMAEASGTIEGSINSAKAAFANWLASLGDQNADVEASTKALLDSVLQVAENAVPLVTNILDALVDSLPQIIEDGIPLIIDAGVKLFMSIIENLPEIIEAILAAVGSIVGSIGEELGKPGALKKMAEAGWNLILGLLNGIKEGIKNIIRNIGSLFGGIVDGIKDFFGIHSPSTVFASMGGYMMQGLANGITDGKAGALKALDDAMEDIAGRKPTIDVNLAPTGYAGGITINSMSINADSATTAQSIFDQIRRAAAQY